MKILIYEWNAYNYKDITEILKALGHDIKTIRYHLDNYDYEEEFFSLLEKEIHENTYDFLFTVNYFGVCAKACHKTGLLYVSWTCDSPLLSMYHSSVFYDTNLIFTFDKVNEMEWKAAGLKNIYYLPLCGEPGRMKKTIENAASKKRALYKAPVSFVGSLYERNSYDSMEPSLYDYERGYFDALIEAQKELFTENIVERMLTPDIISSVASHIDLKQSSEESFSDLSDILCTTALGFKIAKEQRIELLNSISKYNKITPVLYSNSDPSPLRNVRYAGSVDYFGELPLVFYESDINLNITIPNIKSGIPLRVFDVLSSGGFLLTDKRAELSFYFHDEKELSFFSSKEELLDKISYYLSHDTERDRIREAGYNLVLKHHTYKERLQRLLSMISPA